MALDLMLGPLPSVPQILRLEILVWRVQEKLLSQILVHQGQDRSLSTRSHIALRRWRLSTPTPVLREFFYCIYFYLLFFFSLFSIENPWSNIPISFIIFWYGGSSSLSGTGGNSVGIELVIGASIGISVGSSSLS